METTQVSYTAHVVRGFSSKASGFMSGRHETEAAAVRKCLEKVAAGKGRNVKQICISLWTLSEGGFWQNNLIGGSRRVTLDDARKLVEAAEAAAEAKDKTLAAAC